MNQIPELQNAPPQLRLMRARQQTYRRAELLLVLQFVLTVGVPVVAAIGALLTPTIRPYTAALSLLISVIDVTVLDRTQRNHIKLAAKIAELFDCAVLGMPWNQFVAGKPPEPETLAEAAAAWSGDDEKIRDWYPVKVGEAPPHLGRIVCQRTNLWYDATLRRDYGSWVLAGAVILLVGLLAGALAIGLTLDVFIASVVAPAGPIFIWAFREYYRQRDTAEAQETVKGDAEALWERAKSGDCEVAECEALSRAYQNAIFARRAASPLMLPLVYAIRRDPMEARMNQGAAAYLSEIGVS